MSTNLRCFDINEKRKNIEKFGANYVRTTKYTLINFLPLSIFYQYKRLANCYFLALSIIALIPGVSPWAPITQILPTVFVLMVAVIREGVEDSFRWWSDSKTNNRIIRKVQSDGKLEAVAAKEVTVGEQVWVKDGEEIAADMILLVAAPRQS